MCIRDRSTSTGEIRDSIEILEHRGNLLMLAISILVLVLGYLLSKSLVKPFARVSKAIEELTDGYLNEEISVLDYSETQMLSSVFNKMLKRMKVLDDSRQEFVANVSHELKTPMTSIKVLADSLVGQENVPVELYQEFMQDIAVEIDRENKIITDLLALVKMDKKASDLNIEKVNINELMESILKRLKPIADKKKVELVLETYRPSQCIQVELVESYYFVQTIDEFGRKRLIQSFCNTESNRQLLIRTQRFYPLN